MLDVDVEEHQHSLVWVCKRRNELDYQARSIRHHPPSAQRPARGAHRYKYRYKYKATATPTATQFAIPIIPIPIPIPHSPFAMA
jgi:hypothetical protein